MQFGENPAYYSLPQRNLQVVLGFLKITFWNCVWLLLEWNIASKEMWKRSLMTSRECHRVAKKGIIVRSWRERERASGWHKLIFRSCLAPALGMETWLFSACWMRGLSQLSTVNWFHCIYLCLHLILLGACKSRKSINKNTFCLGGKWLEMQILLGCACLGVCVGQSGESPELWGL